MTLYEVREDGSLKVLGRGALEGQEMSYIRRLRIAILQNAKDWFRVESGAGAPVERKVKVGAMLMLVKWLTCHLFRWRCSPTAVQNLMVTSLTDHRSWITLITKDRTAPNATRPWNAVLCHTTSISRKSVRYSPQLHVCGCTSKTDALITRL